MASQFTVRGIDLTTGLMGVWRSEPAAEMSYSFAGADDEEAVVWSVSLPDDTRLARQAVQSGVEVLKTNQQEILRAEWALHYLPQDWLEHETAVAYTLDPSDAGPTSPEPPELERLRHNLSRLKGADDGAIAYGLGTPDEWQETVGDYKDFTREIARLLRPTLITETQLAERILAVTVVGITGDLETTWYQRRTTGHVHTHQQVVSLSLETRLAMLQLLGQISSGAAILGAKFGLGSPILALPAAWRYTRDVMQQARKVMDLGQQTAASQISQFEDRQ